jgi:hypothetical protein
MAGMVAMLVFLRFYLMVEAYGLGAITIVVLSIRSETA